MDNNKYQLLDALWFHNDAVRFDSLSSGKSKVIVFDRAGGAIVDIVEYLLSKEGINQIKRNTLSFDSFEKFNEAFKEFKFQSLKDSCITITDYLMNKKIEWREGY